MDFKGAKNYKPGAYETFSDNLGDMLIDLLNGDEKLLNSPEIQALGASNVKAALEWLATADINGDYKDLIANEGWRLMYKRKPPRPEEFLTWDWIGAQSEGLWPNVRHAFEEFCNPDPLNPKRGLALSTSIGWGKANPVDSNIVVNKTIHLDLEDGTRLNIPSNEIVEILVNGKLTKVSANNLLSMDLESINLPQAVKIKSISYSYTHKKMGDLQVGDEIVGPAGEKFKIREITDHGEQDVYKITLSDGRSFESMLSHLSTVHFRNSHTRPGKKVYDTVTTGYIMDHLEKYLFEIPTDETFKWSELDAPQFLEMLPLHEYEPIDDKYLIPDLTKDPNKVYITKIEKTRREVCKCIAVDYPWGLYLIEDGILTHNSLLTNLCMSYIITHFCLMREPYKVLGHSPMTSYSQPYGTLIQLKDGSWKPIEYLNIGDELMPLLDDESRVTNVVEQGEQDTYELDFGNAKKIRCSLGHWWLVWDFLEKKYVKIQTKELIEAQDRYGILELEDLKRDKKLILECHEQFEKTHTFYENSGFEIKRL